MADSTSDLFEKSHTSRLFDIPNTLDSDDWYTPAWIFDGLSIMFDLDVAAPDETTYTAVTARYRYTVANDGLTAPWFGNVWCNPPYSAPTKWCQKWATHQPGGCILIRADLSTSGPFVAFKAADAMWVPQRRLQFVSGTGARTGAVNFSTVMLGKGSTAIEAMLRLSSKYGGTTKLLNQQKQTGCCG